jgi:N12 class adenine-specific DNA methylase
MANIINVTTLIPHQKRAAFANVRSSPKVAAVQIATKAIAEVVHPLCEKNKAMNPVIKPNMMVPNHKTPRLGTFFSDTDFIWSRGLGSNGTENRVKDRGLTGF